MNQSTVPHTEVSLRLTILSEFLFDEEKPIEELYRSWMRRVGGRIIDFTMFEYWCRRFKNDQFDLGYDTSQDEEAVIGIPKEIQISNNNRSETSNVSNEVNIDLEYDTSLDSKEIFEIQNTMVPEANGAKDVSTMIIESDEKSGNETAVVPNEIPEASEDKNDSKVIIKEEEPVKRVEKQMEDSKLNHQFDEKDVPQFFQTFINSRMSALKEVYMGLTDSSYSLKFDDYYVQFVKMDDHWETMYIGHNKYNETIGTADLEKSVIDHLWFVLKNPNIKLDKFGILVGLRQVLDSEKLTTLLQSMLNSINHQIQANLLDCNGCNEDMFLSLLKHIDSETLNYIVFNILWKEEGNYQNMKEIVETDQWKQAKIIFSGAVTPSKIDEFFQYKNFFLKLVSITPEYVLRLVEHAFNASCPKRCGLFCKDKYDIEAIIDFLRSQNDGTRIIKVKPTDPRFQFGYAIIKFGKRVQLVGKENHILISNI